MIIPSKLPPKARGLMSLQEYTRKEIVEIMSLSALLKKDRTKHRLWRTLEGKTFALIFQKPSTRTRLSIEVAIRELGGHSTYLGWNDLQLGRMESISDTAKVMSRYLDGIIARVHSHNDLTIFAKWSTIPVFNALSDTHHPMQALADLFTINEKKGKLGALKVAFIGDGNNVANSLLIACSKVGLDLFVASPKEYVPDPRIVKTALSNAKESGSIVKVTTEPKEAAKNADVIMTDAATSMGFEDQSEQRTKIFFPRYQVNEKLLKITNKNSIVMHCQPWKIGEEITQSVAYGKQCVAFDQAENRLHTSKAFLHFSYSP
ncbi:MAG: ornithine carbamoyltransferase [Nitrososphaerales archaeon]